MKRATPDLANIQSFALLNVLSFSQGRKTELNVLAFHINEIKAAGNERKDPRVVDKLTLCVKSSEPVFSRETVKQVTDFLKLQEKPVCLLNKQDTARGIKYLYGYLGEQQGSTAKYAVGSNFSTNLDIFKKKKRISSLKFKTAEEENMRNLKLIVSAGTGLLRNLEVTSLATVEKASFPAQFEDDQNSTSELETMVFFDLETTGLSKNNRFITEICMIAITHEQLVDCSADDPSSQCDKLELVVDPNSNIEPMAASITQLTNQIISRSKKQPFNEDVIRVIENFLGKQRQPICLLAHNGCAFDFRILRSQTKENLGESSSLRGCMCADTLQAFRKLSKQNGVKESNTLDNIYKRCFPEDRREKSHQAESDVVALMKVTKSKSEIMELLKRKPFQAF